MGIADELVDALLVPLPPDKPDFTFFPAWILWGIAQVYSFGAGKHAPRGWLTPHHAETDFVSKMHRHLNEYQRGVRCDEDTGLNPLMHMMADAAMEMDRERQMTWRHNEGSITMTEASAAGYTDLEGTLADDKF